MIGICIDDVTERDSVKVRLIGKYHEGENPRKAIRFQDVGLQGIPIGADKGKPGQGIGALRRARNGLGYGN